MTESEPKADARSKLSRLRGLAWAFAIFVAGGFLSTLIGKFGDRAWDTVFPKEAIRIEACLPLKDARVLIKEKLDHGDRILSDQPIEFMNETSVFVQNASGKALKNAVLSIYPLGHPSATPSILYTEMVASSLTGSKAYAVERAGAAYRITIPLFNTKEFILVETKFSTPIGYVVELFSDEIAEKVGFDPGCADGSYTSTAPPVPFFQYYSDRCTKPDVPGGEVSCRIKPAEVLFTVTDENRDKLFIEDHIVR